MNKENLILISINEIQKVKDSHVTICNSFWPLYENKVVFFKKGKNIFPQNNRNQTIALAISKKLYSGNVQFIEIAYAPVKGYLI